MKLELRGGAAHGDASANPTQTSYDSVPPSSTYLGPKVAGTYGGFVGVFTGVGIFILLCLTLGAFIRFRQLARKNSAAATSHSHHSTTNRSGSDFHSDPREHEEAFEMPRAWRGGEGAMGNESTASFDPADVHGGGGGVNKEQEPFYTNIAESRSREVFFEPGSAQSRYDDPYEPRK